MEKKVYAKRVSVSYDVVFGCTRADRSFSTLKVARGYARQRPECKRCSYFDRCECIPNLYKEVISNQLMCY